MDAIAETSFPRFKTEEGRAKYLAAYDAALAAWPVPHEERDVETSLGPTHLIVSGPAAAPPLILLPSFAATGLVWRGSIAAFAARYRCYAIDVIGQPGKSLANRALEGPADYARWLAEVMDALAVARAPIVACSFGAYLAASQALLTPERAERVVLIGPPGVFAQMSWQVALTMRTGRIRRQLRKLTGRKEPSAAATLHAGAAPVHPEDGPWRRLMAITMAEGPALSVTDTRVFTRAELARIAAPMLLLIGEYERLYDPAATLKRARELKPGIEAEMVMAADHIAAMAQPEWVNERVLRFLAG